MSSYALAVTPSIGSVTARGETKIDNQVVAGSGTVFDGAVVETGQSVASAADLRLANNVEITLLRDSRGTLYRDRFILQRGKAQLGSTSSFRVQANGVVVVEAEAHSGGIVSIDPSDSVTVEAKDGTLEIRNAVGASVALVRPGHPLTFSSLTDKSPSDFSAAGTVSSENGRYYLNSTDTGLKYEVIGDNLQNFAGTSVVASGVLEAATPAGGVAGLLQASSIRSPSAYSLPGQSNQSRALIRGFAVSAGVSAATVNKCPPDPLVDCCPGVPFPKCCTPFSASQCSHSN
ncbi:MAG: hypothetical protein WBQ94_13685 [Terracidiphilus sp.]